MRWFPLSYLNGDTFHWNKHCVDSVNFSTEVKNLLRVFLLRPKHISFITNIPVQKVPVKGKKIQNNSTVHPHTSVVHKYVFSMKR